MANNTSRSAALSDLLSTMIAAMQWRLLLLWLVVMLIPATMVTLPLWRMLAGLLDTSVHAAEWAGHFNDIMFNDVVANLFDHPEWLGAVAILGTLFTLLLSPFLTGMIVGSGRAGRVLGFAPLLQNGVIEYGRMFRLTLWSLLPYALVVGVAAMGSHTASKHAETAVLQSQADSVADVAHVITWIVFVLVQSIVESARAAFIADVTLYSATRALGRGIRQLFRRPLRTLMFYVVVTLVGFVLVSIFGIGRIHVAAIGTFGFLLAFVLSQLVVASIGWMRAARLFALAQVARTLLPVRPQAEYR